MVVAIHQPVSALSRDVHWAGLRWLRGLGGSGGR
jgi:hypothetical protein